MEDDAERRDVLILGLLFVREVKGSDYNYPQGVTCISVSIFCF